MKRKDNFIGGENSALITRATLVSGTFIEVFKSGKSENIYLHVYNSKKKNNILPKKTMCLVKNSAALLAYLIVDSLGCETLDELANMVDMDKIKKLEKWD